MPGRCIIDMLRHGDTGAKGFCGSLDMPLSETGWQQMRIATEVNVGWQVILSSPLRRCAEFASALAEQYRLPMVLDARIRELHFGEWEGLDAEQLMQRDEKGLTQFWTDPWCYTPPRGERLADFEQRVRIAWEDACDRYRGKHILFITHGGVIRMLLYLVRHLSRAELLGINVPYASLHTLNPQDANPICL